MVLMWAMLAAKSLPRGGHVATGLLARVFPSLRSLSVKTDHGPMILDMRETVSFPLFKHGHYKHALAEQRFFNERITKDDVVADIGANVGYFTRLFSSLACAVHAFEPSPRALRMLKDNTKDLANVTIYDVALSDHVGTMAFDERSMLDTSTLGSGSTTVNISTLDTISGIRPTFLKVDVEGHEQGVFRGATKTLRSGPLIVFEARTERDRLEIQEIIRAANPAYRFSELSPGNQNYVAEVPS